MLGKHIKDFFISIEFTDKRQCKNIRLDKIQEIKQIHIMGIITK